VFSSSYFSGGFSRYASMVVVAWPDVKSAQDLKGKIVGIQRPGDAYEKSARFCPAAFGAGCGQRRATAGAGNQ